ncbi:MAG: hypothetical protein NTY09_06690 [bacterium]|nr:hypothetical protein [bacterium]
MVEDLESDSGHRSNNPDNTDPTKCAIDGTNWCCVCRVSNYLPVGLKEGGTVLARDW